ncbi:unnamed protein product [Penicillium bialowiezense]
MSSRSGTTLYVTGFGHGTRARDLAYEFERYREMRIELLSRLINPLVLVIRHNLSLSLSLSHPPPTFLPRFSQPGDLESDEADKLTRYGRLVRCDIPAPRTPSSRLFAFVEYESRRDADDAYHEMHNKRIGRDDLLKIEWARTPPSASWRFDSGSGREAGRDAGREAGRDAGRDSARDSGRERRRDRTPPPRRGRSPSPRRSRGADYSPRRDDRYERDDRADRDYDRRDRDSDRRDRDTDRRDRDRSRDRSRSPDDRERDGKDDREKREDDRERREDDRENVPNGDDRKVPLDPMPSAHDELDTAE